jgi:hypothetical protein
MFPNDLITPTVCAFLLPVDAVRFPLGPPGSASDMLGLEGAQVSVCFERGE